MASCNQENRPLLTAPDTNTDPEQARSSNSQPSEHHKPDERQNANSGLTASGHHIDDAHQQTT